jgi:hypothetical protein
VVHAVNAIFESAGIPSSRPTLTYSAGVFEVNKLDQLTFYKSTKQLRMTNFAAEFVLFGENRDF